MSSWLQEVEVLEGEGSGLSSPRSSRLSSPMPGRGRWLVAPPGSREPMVQPRGPSDRMSKAKELFELCDKEHKGFITKRDMQRLQGELGLSPEQLEAVFESLDSGHNGYLTPLEFHAGLGVLVGDDVYMEGSDGGEEQMGVVQVDPAEGRFTQILMELRADKLFKDELELCALWCELQRDRPELLAVLEEVLSQAAAHLHDSLRERETLEQALHRREEEHDRVVRSIYEDVEVQLREEREKHLAEASTQQDGRREQLQEELRRREQELEFSLTNQREMESKLVSVSSEYAAVRGQNYRLQSENQQLEEELEQSREELEQNREQLQRVHAQFQLLQSSLSQQRQGQDRAVLKVSKNMQKEKESLLRQLDLLRDMNRRLRDEKDAHQSQTRVSPRHPHAPPQCLCGQGTFTRTRPSHLS